MKLPVAGADGLGKLPGSWKDREESYYSGAEIVELSCGSLAVRQQQAMTRGEEHKQVFV